MSGPLRNRCFPKCRRGVTVPPVKSSHADFPQRDMEQKADDLRILGNPLNFWVETDDD